MYTSSGAVIAAANLAQQLAMIIIIDAIQRHKRHSYNVNARNLAHDFGVKLSVATLPALAEKWLAYVWYLAISGEDLATYALSRL